MANSTETGHAKNLANFDTLIAFILGYGAAYNPAKESIGLKALQLLASIARAAIDAVNNSLPNYSNAVAAREIEYSFLDKLITRVLNAVKASDTTKQVDESVTTLVRKLKGTRATPKKTEEEKLALVADGKAVKEISTSQMSFDSRLENFDKLIKLLENIPQYSPNEEELKIESLKSLYNKLKSKNADVIKSSTALSNARISRNEVLYKTNTGLVDITFDTKVYIKSLFGATSPQFKQVSKLEFKSAKL